MSNETTNHAWYALRRTLVAWRFDETLAELVAFCRAHAVDEIILKCDTEEFSHGIPTVAWLREYQPLLIRARDALNAAGVVYSLNPWVTVGHTDRSRDIRGVFPGMRMMVGHDGAQTHAQACPLCPVWRDLTRELWTLYAETRPHVIWVEDDIRTFNHKPVSFGCFCAEHLRRFSALVGEPVSRAELVQALLAPGAPHPWRALWLDLQGEVMVDTVRFLQETVHATAPETRLGLMSSGPDNHAAEGRRWSDFGAALAGATPLYSRPPLGSYNENSLRGLYYSAQSIKQTRHCLGNEAIEQTEVENWPFTQYSKSCNFTALQMAVSFACGADGVTMNLFDHMGTPLAENAPFGRMLAAWKPLLNGIAERCRGRAPSGGIRLLHHDRASYTKHLPPGAGYGQLRQAADGWAVPLESLGFATTYEDGPIAAVTGQVLRALDRDAIATLLADGLLLDGSAADVLCRMGYAKDIGVDVTGIMAKDDWVAVAAEEWHNVAFGGAPDNYMSMTLPDLGGGSELALIAPRPGTQVVSRLINPDRDEVMPYLTACKNDRGGRVAVLPFVLSPGRFLALLNPMRQRQFAHLIQWLGPAPLEVRPGDGVCPLPVLREPDATHTIMGAFNLTLDPWQGVVFHYATNRTVARVERLQADGSWQDDATVGVAAEAGRVRLTVAGEIPFTTPVLLDVHWA